MTKTLYMIFLALNLLSCVSEIGVDLVQKNERGKNQTNDQIIIDELNFSLPTNFFIRPNEVIEFKGIPINNISKVDTKLIEIKTTGTVNCEHERTPTSSNISIKIKQCTGIGQLYIQYGSVKSIRISISDDKNIFNSPLSINLSQDEESVLLIDNNVPEIYIVELSTGKNTIISSDSKGIGPLLQTPTAGVFSSDANSIFVVDNGVDALFKIDASTGNRTIISNSVTGVGTNLSNPNGIVLDKLNEFAYVTDSTSIDRVFKIDLLSGDRIVLKDYGVNFTEAINGLTYDENNHSLFVTFFSTIATKNRIEKINSITGMATVISQNSSIGSGSDFINLGDIAIDTVKNSLIVNDNSGLLIEVDLVTGNRKNYSKIDDLIGYDIKAFYTFDLGIKNTLLIAEKNSGNIVKIDLKTNIKSLIRGNTFGLGASLSGPTDIIINTSETSLYVLDQEGLAIIKVDIQSGNRSVISSNTKGSGPLFATPIDLVVDTNEDYIYVGEQYLGAIYKINIATGDRSILSNSVTGAGPVFTRTGGMHFTSDQSKIFVNTETTGWDNIFSVSTINGDRTLLHHESAGVDSRPNAYRSLYVTEDETNSLVPVTAALWSYSLISNSRPAISNNSGIGTGANFNNTSGPIKGITMDSTEVNAYVVSGNFIYKVIMANGNRTIISGSEIGTGKEFYNLNDIVLMSNNSTLFAVDGLSKSIYEVDLVSGNRTILSR